MVGVSGIIETEKGSRFAVGGRVCDDTAVPSPGKGQDDGYATMGKARHGNMQGRRGKGALF
jgi:hypothetical protein